LPACEVREGPGGGRQEAARQEQRNRAPQPTPPHEEALLRRVAGRSLTLGKAREALPRVLEHKWLLSERLGRDVGLRVAAVDYFDNFAA